MYYLFDSLYIFMILLKSLNHLQGGIIILSKVIFFPEINLLLFQQLLLQQFNVTDVFKK